MSKTLEQLFFEDVAKLIEGLRETQVHFITSHRVTDDEYSQAVGYLQGCKEIKAGLEDLLKAYYPRN